MGLRGVRLQGAAAPPHLHAERLQLGLGLDVRVGGEQPLQRKGARLVVRRVALGPPLLGAAPDRAEERHVHARGEARCQVRREQQVLGARGQAQRRRRDRGGGADLL